MLNPAIFPTVTPSVTTENTWDAVSAAQPSASVSVRVHSLPRPGRALLIAELALLAAALIETRFGMSPQVPALIIACCIFFHLQSLDQSIVGANLTDFLSVVLRGVAFGFAVSVGIFRVFSLLGPASVFARAFGSGIVPALLGALAAGLLPVVLRPVLRQMISRKKMVERILIVGTGRLAGKLYRALV